MNENIEFTPKHVTKDGKYMGMISPKQYDLGTTLTTIFKDNGDLEHTLEGTVISNPQSEEGLYAHMVELTELAPQRVRDFYFFNNESGSDVGHITKERVRLYTDMVFIEGRNLKLTMSHEKLSRDIVIKGEVELEDYEGIPRNRKYCFWFKFNEELNDEDFEELKKINVDDIRNLGF